VSRNPTATAAPTKAKFFLLLPFVVLVIYFSVSLERLRG
jgi:hypothetical protein